MKRPGIARAFAAAARRIHRLLTPTLDVHFAGDDSNDFLPWIVGFMVFLTGLVLAAAITLDSAIAKSNVGYSQHVTIEIPYSEGMEGYAEKVIQYLESSSAVRDVSRVDEDEVKKLVEPWLGKGDVIDALPMPVLIDAELSGATKEENEVLQRRLALDVQEKVPSAKVESEQEWADRFSSFTRTIQMIAYIVASLIISAALAMIVMSARTSLKLHARTITLLHQIGARNHYIANQFEVNALMLTLKGALAGTLAALILYAVLGFGARHFDAPLLPSMHFSVSHWVMFLLLPLFTALMSLISARITIMAQLSKIP